MTMSELFLVEKAGGASFKRFGHAKISLSRDLIGTAKFSVTKISTFVAGKA
jgi:hypothetical protein